ncbi:hypothetical protein V5F44_04345 [Xanthobacter sp. V2C-8]|uniref:hypothetical protein n=1 Tax=Xanthobacter albus TaxID=3119929 RepID=UPI0037289AC7
MSRSLWPARGWSGIRTPEGTPRRAPSEVRFIVQLKQIQQKSAAVLRADLRRGKGLAHERQTGVHRTCFKAFSAHTGSRQSLLSIEITHFLHADRHPLCVKTP